MFYALALASMMGYALQSTLLVRHARNIDGLSLGFYRNISFAITMLPLLLFAKPGDFSAVLSHWPAFLLAGVCGSMTMALVFPAYRAIPVGVAKGFNGALHTIFMILFGWAFFGEVLSSSTLMLIGLIMLGCIVLGLQKNSMQHISNAVLVGFLLILLGSIFHTTTGFVYASISRVANPLVSGYFWEVSIAFTTSILIVLRWLLFHKGIHRISLKQFVDIGLCSSPTLIGTACFGLAVTLGPIGVVSAIGAGSLFVITLLSHWLYKEVLTRNQWAALMLIMIGIVELKFVL